VNGAALRASRRITKGLVEQSKKETDRREILPESLHAYEPKDRQGEKKTDQRFGSCGQETQDGSQYRADTSAGTPEQDPENDEEEPPREVDEIAEEFGGGQGEQNNRADQNIPARRRSDAGTGNMEDKEGQGGQAHCSQDGNDGRGVVDREEPSDLNGQTRKQLIIATVGRCQGRWFRPLPRSCWWPELPIGEGES
jgi:hypothetical protein